MADITKILKEAAKDVLSDESLTQIETVFNESVDSKVDERVQIAVEAALIEQDENYADKLQTLVEAIDKDHTNKLERVLEAVDVDHSKKLKALVKKYHRELNNEAKGLKTHLVESVSEYLETYLDEVVPQASINEAVRNKKAVQVLENFRNVLGVDFALAQESVRDGILDGKKQLTEAKSKAKKAQKAQKVLEEKVESLEKEKFLVEQTKNFDEKKARYIEKSFEGKPLEFIKENFDYTAKIFEKKKTEDLQVLKEQAMDTRKTKNTDDRLPSESRKPKNPYVDVMKGLNI